MVVLTTPRIRYQIQKLKKKNSYTQKSSASNTGNIKIRAKTFLKSKENTVLRIVSLKKKNALTATVLNKQTKFETLSNECVSSYSLSTVFSAQEYYQERSLTRNRSSPPNLPSWSEEKNKENPSLEIACSSFECFIRLGIGNYFFKTTAVPFRYRFR